MHLFGPTGMYQHVSFGKIILNMYKVSITPLSPEGYDKEQLCQHPGMW